MKSLILATLALSLLGAGAAAADPQALPERFVAVEQNAVVPRQAIVSGMYGIDRDSLFLSTDRGDYVLDVRERGCNVQYAQVGIISTPRVGIDTASRLRVGGRLCRIEAITKVERRPG